MKKIIQALVLAGLVGQTVICEARGLAFDTIKPKSVMKPMVIEGISRKALKQALEVHNLLVDMHDMDFVRQQGQTAYLSTQLAQKQLDAMEQCSIDKMSDQFKDPKAVWDKMKAEYEKRENELAIYVNASKNATPEEKEQQEAFMLKGIMTDDMVNETFAPWRIGQEILTDVYQNQDNWGERKSKDAPSFSLWEDQKYQFDKEWDAYYTQINTLYGVAPEGRPAIGDEKYDYAQTEKVQKAHDDYIKMLTMTAPNKMAVIPAALKTMPAVPHPLPPKQESVLYLSSDKAEKQIFPAMPDPWQKYAENNFQDVDPHGEMAQDFSNGLNLTLSARKEKKTNRLVVYESLKQSVESAQKIQQVVFKDINARMQRLRTQLKKYLKTVPQPEELIKADVLEQVRAELQAKQSQLVQEAKEELDKRAEASENKYTLNELPIEEIEDIAKLKEINPEAFEQIKKSEPTSFYQRDKSILNALERDPEGKVFINEVNSGEVDRLMKEFDSGKAFLAEDNDYDKEIAAAARVKIDDTCLNGGI